MLKLFHSIFGREAENERYPESLIDAAIERAVDGTDSRLRLVSRYKKHLRPSIIHAIDHVTTLVDGIPPPLEAGRADYAFRLCTGRPSKETERTALLALLNLHHKRLAEGWLSINALATGDPERVPDVPPGTTPRDAAAWTVAARVLLNLDETLSKN